MILSGPGLVACNSIAKMVIFHRVSRSWACAAHATCMILRRVHLKPYTSSRARVKCVCCCAKTRATQLQPSIRPGVGPMTIEPSCNFIFCGLTNFAIARPRVACTPFGPCKPPSQQLSTNHNAQGHVRSWLLDKRDCTLHFNTCECFVRIKLFLIVPNQPRGV